MKKKKKKKKTKKSSGEGQSFIITKPDDEPLYLPACGSSELS